LSSISVFHQGSRDNGQLWYSHFDGANWTGGTNAEFIDIAEEVVREQGSARLEAQNTYLLDEIRSEQNFGDVHW
jgi:hypothetical protein